MGHPKDGGPWRQGSWASFCIWLSLCFYTDLWLMQQVHSQALSKVTSLTSRKAICKYSLQLHWKQEEDLKKVQILPFYASSITRVWDFCPGDRGECWFLTARNVARWIKSFFLLLYLQVRLQVGLYVVYLLDWLTVFDKDQILVLRLEDHASNVKYTMHMVFQFLDLGRCLLPVLREVQKNHCYPTPRSFFAL